MAKNVGGQPWVFDTITQGEGVGNKDAWLRKGPFTAAATDICTLASHGFSTGREVRVEEGNGDLPSGLAESTTYVVSRIDADTFYLCDGRADAFASTVVPVTIADAGTTPNYILTKPEFPVPIYVKYIVCDAAAAGGTFNVTDVASGKSLTGILTLAANTSEQVVINRYVQGVYMTSMADGQILVYHGKY